MAKAIMVQGTMSNAGKSVVTAGLCRIFKQDGYKVAPFKSQNMALNSFVTTEGLEMGRAQVMQAEACDILPSIHMNPILLKPTGNSTSQVIVQGEVYQNMKAVDYFKYKQNLIPKILESYNKLAEEYDIIVIEGAGSPAEINLKQNDIVNMGMAKMAKAPVLLVGDIDRGGVFASLFGTVKLLDADEQEMIKGLIINKFRGDIEILRPGLDMLKDITSKDVLGVIHNLDIDIDDEDSLSDRFNNKVVKDIDIAVIHLPYISNFTDFAPLERFEKVSLRYVKTIAELQNPDLVILPGTKNTIEDLLWLKSTGLFDTIKNLREVPIIGICGGFQMLGKVINDVHNVEAGGLVSGLHLLDVETVFGMEKTRTNVSGKALEINGFFKELSGTSFEGYEIHMGKTYSNCENIFSLSSGNLDGYVNEFVLGTYVHGIFDSGDFTQKLLGILAEKKGITLDLTDFSISDYKNKQYDKLADGMRAGLDIDKIYEIINAGLEI